VNISDFPIWNIDPDLISLGPITIRYYGVLFATGLLLGYYLWRWQMLRAKHDPVVTEKFLVWGVVTVLVGSRLGHCLFYEPEIYLAEPWKILLVWKGGLASHGAAFGLVLALILYAWRYGYSKLEIMDRFAMSVTMGALFVRLGNFMNSEIVGREWWGPWAVRFPRYEAINQNIFEHRVGRPLGYVVEALPRHPSQLYEALGALIIFLVLLAVDKLLGEKRPRGIMAALLLIGYFSFRFGVEFFKEFQPSPIPLALDAEAHVLRVAVEEGMTKGQLLSVPFVLFGIGMLVYALVKRLPAAVKSTKVKEG
jgi:phosphatidylglycerol:prolipoprotein diacylglycerol transferase